MEVKGIINVFVKTTEKGKLFSGSLSRKDKDGVYQNGRINVRFVGEKFPDEKLAKFEDQYCYQIEVKNGFLSFTKNDKGIFWEIVVLDAKCPQKFKVEHAPQAPSDDLLA